MAKKRTIIPHYGKREQRLEQAANHAFRSGDVAGGNELMAAVGAGIRIKAFQNARMLASRPTGQFTPVPRNVAAFMRRYSRG